MSPAQQCCNNLRYQNFSTHCFGLTGSSALPDHSAAEVLSALLMCDSHRHHSTVRYPALSASAEMRQPCARAPLSSCVMPTKQLGSLNKYPLHFEADLFNCPEAFSCFLAPAESQNLQVMCLSGSPSKGPHLCEGDGRRSPCILFALALLAFCLQMKR